ncbi:MAG: squalene/phytoene synthase family protein [Candidatus Auribacterota bacterium]|nr:squalene/phytoene synthase family protein [Candidatus Auribacterota bacterium]
MMTDKLTYCRQILPRVSRTFALGIELLQDPLRDVVCVSYLICRIIDTIEDTTSLPAKKRADLLEQAGRELSDPDRWEKCCRVIKDTFPEDDFKSPDHDLCRHSITVMELFYSFPETTRKVVTGPVREMAEGMAKTVRRELGEGGLRLETIEDLKQYCYYVAGTVGKMLTELFSLDRESITPDIRDQLRHYGNRFGLGLQLTNIIKGITDDRSRGVCYIPRELLAGTGLTLDELIDHPDDPRGAMVINELVKTAVLWLDDALEYTLSIPSQETDLRLFCGLPLIFAVRTLELAGRTTAVFGEESLKITREEVTDIYLRLQKICADDAAIRDFHRTEKNNILYPD